MEQKFGKNSIDIEVLREFCEREGKKVEYRKGEQLEREGDPAWWFGFVTEGCFKYLSLRLSEDFLSLGYAACLSKNFVARNDSRRRLQHDMNAQTGYFRENVVYIILILWCSNKTK